MCIYKERDCEGDGERVRERERGGLHRVLWRGFKSIPFVLFRDARIGPAGFRMA